MQAGSKAPEMAIASPQDPGLLDFTCGRHNWLDVHFCESDDAPGAPQGELLPDPPPAENVTSLDVEAVRAEAVRASMFRSTPSNSGSKLEGSEENANSTPVCSVTSREAEIDPADWRRCSAYMANMPTLLRPSHLQPRFSNCDKQVLKSNFDEIRSWCSGGGDNVYKATHQNFTFTWKSRKCKGLAIHIAAMHKCGFEVFSQLLELKANLHDECSYIAFGKEGRAQPILLAAGRGHVKNVKDLLSLRADIHAQGRHDNIPHASALHEAAFAGHSAVAKLLIRQGASIFLTDSKQQTPLHTAARAGAAEIANMLLKRQADPADKDEDEMTPLKLAIGCGKFPDDRLSLLAQPIKSDYMWIALSTSPCRMEEVLRKYSSRELACHDRQSQESPTVEDFDLSDFLHLMKHAPRLAEALLAATTNTPESQSNHHPLPLHAYLNCDMLCEYVPELYWAYDAEKSGRGCPQWHDNLAPPRKNIRSRKHRSSERIRPSGALLANKGWQDFATDMSKSQLSRVEIKQLQLQGIMCVSVFHELSKTKLLSIFQLPAVQAIVQCMWDKFVRHYYTRCVVYHCLELLLLVVLTVMPRGHHYDYVRLRAWSMILVISTRDACREFGRIYGYTCRLKDPRSYLRHYKSPFKLFRVTSIALCCSYSWIVMLTRTEDDGTNSFMSPIYMTLAVFSCWMHLLSMLCVCSWYDVGKSIIPILSCLEAMTGIIVILLITYAAFLHAFLVLEVSDIVYAQSLKDLDLDRTFQLVTDSVRILFVGDGDPIDKRLKVDFEGDASGGHVKAFNQLVVIAACVFFSTCILNLFVGVYANAYNSFQQKAPQLFLQQRYQQCLHCMLQPQWADLEVFIGHAYARFQPQSSRESFPSVSETPENARHFPSQRFVNISTCITVVAWLLWLVIMHMMESRYALLWSSLLLGAMLLSDGLLTQLPWRTSTEASESSGHYLWWCTRIDQDASKPTAQQELISSMESLRAQIRMSSALDDPMLAQRLSVVERR